ncbi:MAG: class I SAM-dependent DNA methyltransferase [Thermodesulfobacteriota bacterium]
MNQDLRRKLDRITDILWGGGVTNPVTYIEQISYLIYLKLLDEEESSRELKARLLGKPNNGNGRLLYPKQAERYRWTKWRFKSGPDLRDYVRDEVFPYMASLVKEEPQIAEYFRDAILEVVDPNVLKQVVDEIDGIDFAKLGTDVKGDIFEYLLTHLGQSALNGQFRTPRQIRTMMVVMLDPDLGDTIFDPACGTGGFLIDSVEYILAKYSTVPQEVPIYGEEWLDKLSIEDRRMSIEKENHQSSIANYDPKSSIENHKSKIENSSDTIINRKSKIENAKKVYPTLQTYRKGPGEKIPDWGILERSIYGIDVSRQMMRIAMMNLVLHGIRKANVKRANALSDMGGLSEDDLSRRYKVILSNPPFAGVLPKESIRKDLPTNSKKSELLFLGIMMEALAPGGQCAVVVPEGLLFGSTSAHIELRRKLIEDFELLAVVSLPAGVFKPYAGVKTGILVFRKPLKIDDRRSKIKSIAIQSSIINQKSKIEDSIANHQSKISNGKVWFYEIRADGFDPDKISGGGRPETPDRNDIPDLLLKWTEYKRSGFKKIPGVEAGTLLPAGSEESRCWWATIESITGNDYNLAAGRYKPQIAEKSPDEDPAELIREILVIEQVITNGLDKLLKEIETVE